MSNHEEIVSPLSATQKFAIWPYVKLILTLLPGEINLDAAFKAFNEAQAKGGGLKEILTSLVDHSEDVFPDPVTRPIAVLALEGILRIYHGPAIVG